MKKTHLSLVKQSAVQFIKAYNPQIPLLQQLEGHLLLQRMKLLQVKELNIPSLENRAKVAERTLETVLDELGLRISLYYMPKGAKMPLHDHPQMMVLTFILEGKIDATLYTPTEQNSFFFKEKQCLITHSWTLIDGLRTNQRNLHQLQAAQNTLFIDIIFPDYDDSERDCSCFVLQAQMKPNIWKLRQVPCIFDMQEL